nr:TolC family protein [Citrobacter gillenii]
MCNPELFTFRANLRAYLVFLMVIGISVFPVFSVHALTLQQLIAISVETHPSVKSSENLYGAAHSEEDAAWQNFLPTPSISLDSTDSGSSRGGVATLQQPLWFISGTQKPLYQAAESRARGAKFAVYEAQDGVALNVLNAYGAWLNAADREGVARSDLVYLGTLLNQIDRRVSSGASAPVERALVVSRRLSSQGIEAASHSAAQAALEQLMQMTGETLQEQGLYDDKTLAPVLPGQEQLLEEALARNPTLKRLRAETKALKSEVSASHEALKPQIYVQMQESWRHGSENDHSIGLGVRWSPGAGLSSLSATNAASSRALAARESEENAARQVKEQLGSTYAQYEGTRQRLSLQLDSLQTLISIRDSYLRQFNAGRRQWQEVMNAAQDVSEARYTIADMRASLLISGYQLLLLARGNKGTEDAKEIKFLGSTND